METTDRKSELLELCACMDDAGKAVAPQLVDEMLFLEHRLIDLRAMPFLSVNPKNPAQQRATPAAKQYKELLQQYTNIVKVLCRLTGAQGEQEESPLRDFMKQLGKAQP